MPGAGRSGTSTGASGNGREPYRPPVVTVGGRTATWDAAAGVYHFNDTGEIANVATPPSVGRTGGVTTGGTVQAPAPGSDGEQGTPPVLELDPNSPEFSASAIMRRRKSQLALRYGFLSTLRSLRAPRAATVNAYPPGTHMINSPGWTGKMHSQEGG